MSLAIQLQGLEKTYRVRQKAPGFWGALKGLVSAETRLIHAVKGLSFSVKEGEAVGLIGENGAGKSTTMKCLTGILKPSAGTLSVLGRRPWAERRKLAGEIGVVFGQKPQLLWDIAVRESFELNRILYRIPAERYAKTRALLEGALELGPLLSQPVRQLSLGQRMRADLACALLHAPRIAFLDEPTIGLDVLAKEQARQLLKEFRRRFGTTLLLTTHDLKDIADTCQRVVLLDKGALLFDGSLKAFEARFARERRIIAELEAPLAASARKKLAVDLKRLGGTLLDGGKARVSVEYVRDSAAPKLTALLLRRLKVADLLFEKAELDHVVRRIYAGTKGG